MHHTRSRQGASPQQAAACVTANQIRLACRTPAQDRLPRRSGLVEPPHRRRVRRAPHQLGTLLALPGDGDHRVAEGVQLFLRLALGRLDHQRAGDDQREVDRRRMEAVVHQPLGDVERVDVVGVLPLVAEDDLVQRRCVVRQVIRVAQPGADVVRVEHGDLGDAAQAVRSHAAHVSQRAHENAEIAVEGAHPADGIGMVVIEVERPVLTSSRPSESAGTARAFAQRRPDPRRDRRRRAASKKSCAGWSG